MTSQPEARAPVDAVPKFSIFDRSTRGWPSEAGGRMPSVWAIVPLREALTTDWRRALASPCWRWPWLQTMDASMQGCAAPLVPVGRDVETYVRIKLDAIGRAPIRMRLFIADIDVPKESADAARRISGEEFDGWQAELRSRLDHLHAVHPHWRYSTPSGGWRLLWTLTDGGQEVRTMAEAETWSAYYVEWCAHLRERFGVEPDSRCRDVPRIFRLPFAQRRGSTEIREPIIELTEGEMPGLWLAELSTAALDRIRTVEEGARGRLRESGPSTRGVQARGGGHEDERSREAMHEVIGVDNSPASEGRLGPEDGVLGKLFVARGWARKLYDRGRKLAVICPWSTDAVHVADVARVSSSSPPLSSTPAVNHHLDDVDVERHPPGDPTSTFVGRPNDAGGLGTWTCSHATCTGRDWRDVLAQCSNDELMDAGYEFRSTPKPVDVVEIEVEVVRCRRGSLVVRRLDDPAATNVLPWHMEAGVLEERGTGERGRWRLLLPVRADLQPGQRAKIRITTALAVEPPRLVGHGSCTMTKCNSADICEVHLKAAADRWTITGRLRRQLRRELA